MFDKTNVYLGQDALKPLIQGVNTLADAVGSTLGPNGRNVIIQQNLGLFVTKDGVTVAKNIVLPNSLENLGATLVKQAANRTNTVAGDGTTTVTVLTQGIINQGVKDLKGDEQLSSLDYTYGMKKASQDILSMIDEEGLPIKGDWEAVKNVATISSNNDEELGSLIAEAFEKVGEFGFVMAEKDSKSMETTVEITEGMNFDRGFTSPYFVTNPEKMYCEYEDVLILIYDGKITNVRNLVPVMEICAEQKKPLLLIAEDFDPQTMSILITNRMQAGFPVVAVKAPGFARLRTDYLHDIATLTNGVVYSDGEARPLSMVNLEGLGKCKKIRVTKNDTSIVGGEGTKEAIEQRAELLKAQLENSEQSWNREKIQQRIAKLVSGVALIKVGGITDSEVEQKKFRIEDAVNAVTCALKEGIVPGGGHTYLNLHKALGGAMKSGDNTKSFNQGYDNIVGNLRTCFDKLCKNSGLLPETVSKGITKELGYNFKTNQYENLLKTGVIDPVIVAKEAIQNAVSVSEMILTTNCALTKIDPEQFPEGQEYDPSMIVPEM